MESQAGGYKGIINSVPQNWEYHGNSNEHRDTSFPLLY